MEIGTDETKREEIREKLKKKNPVSKEVNVLRIILNVLTVASILMPFIVLGILTANYPAFTYLEKIHCITKNSWLFYVFLPIPIGNICLGIIFRKKDKMAANLILGFVFSVLLCLIGTPILLSQNIFSTNKKTVDIIETKTGIDIPNDFDVVSVPFVEKDITLQINNFYIRNVSSVRINSNTKMNVDNSKWNYNIYCPDYVPNLFNFHSNKYDYFLVYDNQENVINPSTFDYGKSYYCIGYEYERNYLLIVEYNIVNYR